MKPASHPSSRAHRSGPMWLLAPLIAGMCAAGCGRDIAPVEGFRYATTAERQAALDATADGGGPADTGSADTSTSPTDTSPRPVDAAASDVASADGLNSDGLASDAVHADSAQPDAANQDGDGSSAQDTGPTCTPATAAIDCDDKDACTHDLCAGDGHCTHTTVEEACCVAGKLLTQGKKCGPYVVKKEYKCSDSGLGGKVMLRAAWGTCDGVSPACDQSESALAWGEWIADKTCPADQVCEVAKVDQEGQCVEAPSALKLCPKPDKYEAGTTLDTAVSVGSFKDHSNATVLDPDLHMGSNDDVDYVKYTIEDVVNLFNPRVEIGWTASDVVEVCAWYACEKGSGGKDCKPVKCDKGSGDHHPKVSATVNNGCCAAGKAGAVRFNPTSGATNDSGTAYLRVRNLAKTCQYVNTKIIFAGGDVACGDGAGNDCAQDQGTCVNKCGQYDSAKPCQCDDGCVKGGDCCWDWNLNCF